MAEDKHVVPVDTGVLRKGRRRSWREKVMDNRASEEDNIADQLSLSSYLSASSKGMSSVKSSESVNDTRSMVTAVSGSVGDDTRMMTSTEDDEEGDSYPRRYITDQTEEQPEQTLVKMLEQRLTQAESRIHNYRDENAVLKCELRDLQESLYAHSDVRLKEKIARAEALCDELMEENQGLKAEVKELQREIEEMQDHYREEEIEEFREMQRELDQNAKNCRVLQFKLRKAERLREETDSEKLQLQCRINDLLAGSLEEASTPRKSESSRVRELESELRIAKEVSVRLHTELEQTEEKSSRLEDEVSSMREKVWELQTQNKWREPRNKADIITEWEQNHKCVREFEIKYKKLESIFNREREVINDERTQKKNNITLLKKIAADAETSPEEARHELEKKEVVWKFAETSLEKEIAYLKKQLSGSSVEEGNEHDKPALHDLDAGKTLSSVLRDSEQTLLEEIKKRLSHYEEKYSEIEAQLEKMRSHNEELLEQLNKTKFEWQKDKEAQQHKARQTEKIRLVEMDALRQKFSSRMRIMEDTNKSLHSQLILVRRERDTQRKALSSFERQVLEDHKKNDTRDKEISRAQEKIEFMQKRLSAVEAELERANTDLRITKEARRADQILWKINRARGGKETLSSGDFRAIEQLQSHFQEYERFYVKETERLNKILTSMSEELQEQKNSNAAEIIAKLRQQERVLEIKQKKLAQKKDVQAVASETLEAGTSRLEQLQFVSEPVHCNGKSEYDGNSDEMRYIISQLIAIMDEDTQTLLPSDEPTHPWIDWIGHAPSGSECEASYENISQSPTSIRSVVSMPTRSSFCTETRRGYEYQGHLSIQRRHSNLSEYLGGISEQRKECVDENVRREFEPKEPESSNAYLTVTRTFSFDGAKEQLINKKSGNSILCRVRREELARGGEPSVRLMARAFETIDTCTPVRQKFFSIRKSRSVESAQGRSHFESSSHPSISMHNNSQSDTVHEPAYETLPREGRSTLKNMGSKLVNRVRRSLSRSRGGDKECREGAELKAEGARTKKDLCSILLEETRNRSAEKKTQKSGS